ncbi:MAG TPA: hypothetical protein VKD72_21555, partial [Gemmataceae bacterium]|nr:hypothetical protein [Gemmataceae bacterium]
MSRPEDRPDSPAPRPPGRRGLAALLAAFMEEHNILWGELVGGLLVIGCSTALVISLWHTLSENPLFKFATFTGAVSAVYGAGLYTLRRWKLESTSRGLLLMALLLTPLAELALTSGGSGRLALPTQVAALLILGLLAWRAARVLAPDGPWLLAAAVVLTSACQLPVARMVEAGVGAARFVALSLLPAVCLVAVTAAFLWQLSATALDNRRSASVFVFLGVGTFSLLVVLGFAVFLHGDVATALGKLALPAAVAGLAPLVGGAFVHRGLADYAGELSLVEEGEDERSEGRWASVRTGGTTVALTGIVVMLLAVGLAWPQPQTVLAVCALDFVALTVVALRFGLPVAHAVALPCLTGAYLMAWFLSRGLLQVPDDELPARMLELMEAPATGTAILVLFALCSVVSELLARWVAGEHGKFYAFGSAGIALLSLAFVTPHGLQEPARALIVYAVTGIGALLLNLRWRRAEATSAGLVLLIGATLW